MRWLSTRNSFSNWRQSDLLEAKEFEATPGVSDSAVRPLDLNRGWYLAQVSSENNSSENCVLSSIEISGLFRL